MISLMAQSEEPSVPVESVVRRYAALIQIICTLGGIAVTWYISTTVSAGEMKMQVQNNTARIVEQDKKIDDLTVALDRVLTKEVYEAHRRGDVERSERMEKLLLQILNDRK